MTRHNVAQLEGALLDAAVAKAEGIQHDASALPRAVFVHHGADSRLYRPSTEWLDGGPIIERELIFFGELPIHQGGPEVMEARCGRTAERGRGHLQSAMRAFVVSRFGETVDLP
jgi:hypothetical protein